MYFTESHKIKSKILSILNEDIALINIMIKTSSNIEELSEYFSSDEYKNEYERISKIEDVTKKDFEIVKLDSKMHWIFKCIDEGYLDNSLFLNKNDDLIEDETIKTILLTIIQTVEQFKLYTLDDSYSNQGKNKPTQHKKEDLKTITKFKTLLDNLELGGEVRMYKEQKEKYDINNDEFINFNINHMRIFLDELSNEIKEIDGNNKKSFSESYNLGIKYKYHNPRLDGLRIELKKRLKCYVQCSNDNLDPAINNIIEFLENLDNENLL